MRCAGDALVENQAGVDVRQVVVGNQRRQMQVHFVNDGGERLAEVWLAASADSSDGALQHLHVEREADGGYLAGLLFAEQFASAADLQIVGGQRETDAQLAGRL